MGSLGHIRGNPFFQPLLPPENCSVCQGQEELPCTWKMFPAWPVSKPEPRHLHQTSQVEHINSYVIQKQQKDPVYFSCCP